MFGLGTFISPLLVEPFLTSSSAENHHFNTTNTTNNSLPVNYSFHSNHTSTTSNDNLLRYPYIISMLLFLIPIVTFVGASFKDTGRNQQREKPWELNTSNDHRAYRGFTLVFLFLFLMLYVGLEVAIGGLIFSFSFHRGILKTKSFAAYLTTTFWGSFCFGRLLSIPLSMYVRPFRILVMDLIGCIIGASILVFLATSVHAWLWIGSSILGFCMAAVFPSTMSWGETFMHISGKTASILVVGASLGEMTIPFTIGSLMAQKGPDVFLYSVFIILILASIVFIIASILARQQLKQQTDNFGFHYHKGNDESSHRIFSKGDEVIQLLEDSSEIFSVDN